MTETVAVFTKYFVDVEESLGRIGKIQNISHIYQRLFFFVTYLSFDRWLEILRL